jgi:division protein CdvB (Snf7/Vps24/ESCRT-III family)
MTFSLSNFTFRFFEVSRSPQRAATKHDLDLLEEKIMAKTAAVIATIAALSTQLTKVNAEINGKIAKLEEAIRNQDEVSPEVEAALNDLKAKVQGLDDIVPDQAQEPTPEPTPTPTPEPAPAPSTDTPATP